MISIKKENNELKISFEKFNMECLKNIPFVLLSIISIPFLYYSLWSIITIINHITTCILHSFPIIYNSDPIYRFLFLTIFTMYLIDICIVYKLFPKYKLFEILYIEKKHSLNNESDIKFSLIPISLLITFSIFYLIGFWSLFEDPKDFFLFAFFDFVFHVIYTSTSIVILIITIICNIIYFLDLIKLRFLL